MLLRQNTKNKIEWKNGFKRERAMVFSTKIYAQKTLTRDKLLGWAKPCLKIRQQHTFDESSNALIADANLLQTTLF